MTCLLLLLRHVLHMATLCPLVMKNYSTFETHSNLSDKMPFVLGVALVQYVLFQGNNIVISLAWWLCIRWNVLEVVAYVVQMEMALLKGFLGYVVTHGYLVTPRHEEGVVLLVMSFAIELRREREKERERKRGRKRRKERERKRNGQGLVMN